MLILFDDLIWSFEIKYISYIYTLMLKHLTKRILSNYCLLCCEQYASDSNPKL